MKRLTRSDFILWTLGLAVALLSAMSPSHGQHGGEGVATRVPLAEQHASQAMGGKYLQLLHETVPKASRVAILNYQPRTQLGPGFEQDLAAAAQALNLTLQYYEVREPQKLDDVFAAMTKARAEALVVKPHSFMWENVQRIVDLAARTLDFPRYRGQDAAYAEARSKASGLTPPR